MSEVQNSHACEGELPIEAAMVSGFGNQLEQVLIEEPKLWIEDAQKRVTERYMFFAGLNLSYRVDDDGRTIGRSKYATALLSGIRKGMSSSFEDDFSTEDLDLFQQAALCIWESIDRWMNTNNSAKLTSRLFAFGKKTAFLYHTAKVQRRRAAVEKNISTLYQRTGEVLSQLELASMRFEEMDNEAA